MSCCGDCLRLAELARDAPEELSQVVFGMVERLSTHAEGDGNSAAKRLLFVFKTLPPLIFFSGHKPNQDANAEAFRNCDISVPISHKMV